MQIGTEDGAVRTTADALVAGPAVIPMTAKDASEWALRRSQARAAAVVLEAGEHPSAARSRSTSMATLPISRGPSSRTVSRSTRPTPGSRSPPSS